MRPIGKPKLIDLDSLQAHCLYLLVDQSTGS